MSEESEQTQATARSPLSGCAILIIAFVVMIFFVCSMVFSLFRQSRAIEEFTEDQPAEIEVIDLEGRDDDLASLNRRLTAFQGVLAKKEEARLELSAEDINLAIASQEPFAELRETFRIDSIEGDRIRIQISYPLNKGPKSLGEFFTLLGDLLASPENPEGQDYRYLNGVLIVKPVLAGGQIIPKIIDIEAEKNDVPDGFVDQMTQYRPAERYIEHELLGPLMAKLTEVTIEEGKLVLIRVPGEDPATELTDEQVNQGAQRFLMVFGTAATLFLIFAGIMIFIGLRAKAKQDA